MLRRLIIIAVASLTLAGWASRTALASESDDNAGEPEASFVVTCYYASVATFMVVVCK
jgi:hypothetical protein